MASVLFSKLVALAWSYAALYQSNSGIEQTFIILCYFWVHIAGVDVDVDVSIGLASGSASTRHASIGTESSERTAL